MNRIIYVLILSAAVSLWVLVSPSANAGMITSITPSLSSNALLLHISADTVLTYDKYADPANSVVLYTFAGTQSEVELFQSGEELEYATHALVRSYELRQTPIGSQLLVVLGPNADATNVFEARQGTNLVVVVAPAGSDFSTVDASIVSFRDPPLKFVDYYAYAFSNSRIFRLATIWPVNADTPVMVGSMPSATASPARQLLASAISDTELESSSFHDRSSGFSARVSSSGAMDVVGRNVEQKGVSETKGDFRKWKDTNEGAVENLIVSASSDEGIEENAKQEEEGKEAQVEAGADEEDKPPILKVLSKEQLEQIAKAKAAEVVVSAEDNGVKVVVESKGKETVTEEKRNGGKVQGRDVPHLRWIPESEWRKMHPEVNQGGTTLKPPPKPAEGLKRHPWDVKRPRLLERPLELTKTPSELMLERERVTFETTDTTLKEALTLLVASTSFNVIVEPEIGDMKVTLSFRDTPLKNVLDALCAAKGIMYKLIGNTIIVGSREDIGRRLGGFITKTFVLDYADANDVKNVLIQNGLVSEENVSAYYGESESTTYSDGSTVLSEGDGGISAGDIKRLSGFLSTARSNILVITETPEKLRQIEQVIEQLDRKPRVISLETTIVEVSEKGLKKLGFEIEEEVRQRVVEEQALEKLEDGRWVEAGQKGFIALGLWFQTIFREPLDVLFTLRTVIEEGEARILARPNLTAIEGRQAIYFAGTLIPYITRPAIETPTTFMPPQVDFQAVGITLSFKPRVDWEGNITLEVNPVVSTLIDFIDLGAGAVAPQTQTRQVTTTVRVRNGETFVIAGMLSENERETLKRIPILGQIPLFEKLFSSKDTVKERTEIMVFVTPIIREE